MAWQENGAGGSVISDREMHVVASVEEWNKGLPQSGLKQKYQKMASSPLMFFQGTNHLFWADLSGDERLTRFGNAKTTTWIVGDCTVSSFAATGSDADGPMYGLNAFYESVVADYQYDVWRLATSLALLAKANLLSPLAATESASDRTPDSVLEAQKHAVMAFAQRYLRTATTYKVDEPAGAGGSPARTEASKKEAGAGGKGEGLRNSGSGGGSGTNLAQLLASTGGSMKGRLVRFMAIVEREFTRKRLLKTWCVEADGQWKFSEEDPGQGRGRGAKVQRCPRYEEDVVIAALASYSGGVNAKALVRRLAADPAACGVPRYMALTEASDGDLHILDIRMQQRPTAYHFMNPEERRAYRIRFPHEVDRVMEAARHLCPLGDASMGWIDMQEGVHPSAVGRYIVRDVSPFEEEYPAIASDELKAKLKQFALTSQEALVELAEDWGRVLAAHHASAAAALNEGSALSAEARTAFGRALNALARPTKGGFEELVWEVAGSYSRQVEYDWEAFRKHLIPLYDWRSEV